MKLLNLGVALIGLFVLAACSTNPHKAVKIDTEMESKGEVADEKLGVKDGNMIIQRKVLMSEELRMLQNDVYEMEDRVYGNRKYGSQGLYGTLKSCKVMLHSRALGGDGKLRWSEPIDRVTDKEDKLKIGLDEKDELVGVSEEFLKDRIKRFRGYKRVLQKREDEYKEKLEICDAAVAAKEYDKKKNN